MKWYKQILLFFSLLTASFLGLLQDDFWGRKSLLSLQDYSWLECFLLVFFLLSFFALWGILLGPLRILLKKSAFLTKASPKKLKEDMLLAEQIHKHVYQDPVTGLGNRGYFNNVFQQVLSGKEVVGTLILIEFQGLKQYNEAHGFLAGNEFIKKIGLVIKENCSDIKLNFLARIGGSTFAILAPYADKEEIENYAVGLKQGLEALIIQEVEKNPSLAFHIGIVLLSGIDKAADLMGFADIALKKAKQLGPFNHAYYEEANKENSKPMSMQNISSLQQHINQLIEDNQVTVAYQPVYGFAHKNILSYEALLRIKNGNKQLLDAARIVPTADRYGLTYLLDKAVITQVLEKTKTSAKGVTYSINLSASTLIHEPTLQWLLKTLGTGKYANKIVFELDENTILNHGAAVRNLVSALQPQGIGFGLDYYGCDFANYDYLKTIPLLYIKIAGHYIRNLEEQDVQFFILFLTRMIHAMGIKVIAKCVETQSQWDLLQSSQLDAAQGIFCELVDQKK